MLWGRDAVRSCPVGKCGLLVAARAKVWRGSAYDVHVLAWYPAVHEREGAELGFKYLEVTTRMESAVLATHGVVVLGEAGSNVRDLGSGATVRVLVSKSTQTSGEDNLRMMVLFVVACRLTCRLTCR